MKDIISSFTVLLIACGWFHLSGIAQMTEPVVTFVMITIYAHIALAMVYIVKFIMAMPRVRRPKVAVVKPAAHEEVEHHLSLVMD